MDTFVLLLRSKRQPGADPIEPSIESSDIRDRASSFRIVLFDVAVTVGIFHAVVFCGVEDRRVLEQFLDEMEPDWECDFLLVKSHVRMIEGLPIVPSSTRTPNRTEN